MGNWNCKTKGWCWRTRGWGSRTKSWDNKSSCASRRSRKEKWWDRLISKQLTTWWWRSLHPPCSSLAISRNTSTTIQSRDRSNTSKCWWLRPWQYRLSLSEWSLHLCLSFFLCHAYNIFSWIVRNSPWRPGLISKVYTIRAGNSLCWINRGIGTSSITSSTHKNSSNNYKISPQKTDRSTPNFIKTSK